MQIRLAERSDLPRIAEIYNQAIATTTATFDLEPKALGDEWLGAHTYPFPAWVVIQNENVLAWASIGPWSDRGAYSKTVKNSIYVDEGARGKGCGKLLLAELDRQVPKLGFHTVIAGITAGNEVSVRLHKSFGFTLSGTLREVGYKFQKYQDVHLYQKLY